MNELLKPEIELYLQIYQKKLFLLSGLQKL